jgi:hypothetical protein
VLRSRTQLAVLLRGDSGAADGGIIRTS